GDVACVAARLADDGAGVGVAGQDYRAAERRDEAGEVRGVDSDAAQQVRRRHHVEPGRLELGDDAVPARGVDEGAVDQDDGGGDVRGAHEDLPRYRWNAVGLSRRPRT